MRSAVVVITEYKFAIVLQQLIEHTATRLVQAVALAVAAIDWSEFVRLLASIVARPIVLTAEPLIAFVSGFVIPEVVLGLVVVEYARQLVATELVVAQVAASPSSAFSSLHPTPSCASFSRSQQCTSSHKFRDYDRQTLAAG